LIYVCFSLSLSSPFKEKLVWPGQHFLLLPLLPHCPLLLVLIGEISQSVEEEPEKQEWRFAIEYAKQNKNKSK
jgi:hypothetical protein